MSALVDTINHCAGNNVYCVLSPQIYVHISIQKLIPQNVRYEIRANVKELGSEYGVVFGSFIGRLIAHDCTELARAESLLQVLFKRYQIFLRRRDYNREQNKNAYVHVMKTNLMHNLSSVYFVNQPLHVSSTFVANLREVYCIYTTIGTCCTFQLIVCWPGWNGHSIKMHKTYQLLYIYSIPPDDGPQMCPKHVEVD